MRRMRLLLAVFLLSLTGTGLPSMAAQLPGGKGSFVELHGDWTVACRGQNGVVGCVVSQVQADPQTGKPMLSAEFRALRGGAVAGALLVPFGLVLGNGVSVTIDASDKTSKFAFSTCLPGGCLVPVSFDPQTVESFSSASVMSVGATLLSTGEDVPMRISLNGVSAALARATELSK